MATVVYQRWRARSLVTIIVGEYREQSAMWGVEICAGVEGRGLAEIELPHGTIFGTG